MKVALIYDVNDHNLSPSSYSQTYRHMLDALAEHDGWESVCHLAEGCEVPKDVDVIIIYDIHSSYHANVGDLANHKALKYTYFNDPHQTDMHGQYKDGTQVHKLGARNRVARAKERGIDFIICPYTDGYNKFIARHVGKDADKRHFWFPVAPKVQDFDCKPLAERKQGILGNGHLWEGIEGFRPYKFRNWAYRRENVDYVKHSISDNRVPNGNDFVEFLSNWQGGLALTDWYVVPKYLEIPLAGCVCFAQYHEDYKRMGFSDGLNYFEVGDGNFDSIVGSFVNDYKNPYYQEVADAGRELILNNYTAEHFAKAVFAHAKGNI